MQKAFNVSNMHQMLTLHRIMLSACVKESETNMSQGQGPEDMVTFA
jgi:ribosomal protein L5